MKRTKTSTIFLAIAAVLALGVAAAQAQETVNVKMTFSGTAVDNSVINIQPNTSEDEDTFAGTGTLGSFTLHNVRAISNNVSSNRRLRPLSHRRGRRGRTSPPGWEPLVSPDDDGK